MTCRLAEKPGCEPRRGHGFAGIHPNRMLRIGGVSSPLRGPDPILLVAVSTEPVRLNRMFGQDRDEPDSGPPGPDPEAHGESRPLLAGVRVVVVEDEAIISMEIEDMLVAMGAEVVGVAMSADEAVRLAETERPHCMTMDINLRGDRDGVSAAAAIFERFGIRSVFVSAYSDRQTMARAQGANPLGWLTKPLSRPKLEAVFRSGIRSWRND